MYQCNYLAHYGAKGMRWGVRKYQNPDGSLTPEGKERYSKGIAGFRKKLREGKIRKLNAKIAKKDRFLNNPKVQAKLAKASQSTAKYNLRKAQYERAQARADRAIFFRDYKQQIADKKRIKMYKANKPKQAKFVAKYKTVEYKKARLSAKKDKVVNKYIKKYGSQTYKELFGG